MIEGKAGQRWMAGRRGPVGLGLLHVAVATVQYCRGLSFSVDIERCRWDYFWQAIPVVDLIERPGQSFWLLHAQPPGYSAWGWVWLRLGGAGAFPGDIQLGYVVLGAAVTAMTWSLARTLTRSEAWAWAAGLAMALNPSLLLYESYLLYEMLVIFFVTASAWALARGVATRRGRWIVIYIMALNALVLTRSLYHLVFLVGALAFAWPVGRGMRPGRRATWFALALVLPAGWYAKNAVQYGFFGPSSWQGMGWYKAVSKGYSFWELRDLNRAGVLPGWAVELTPYDHAPRKYEEYGFNLRAEAALLARNDFHNINVPEISRQFGVLARELIRRDPLRYLRVMHDGYVKFCRPPSQFLHLKDQRDRHVGWEPLAARWVYGQGVTDAIKLFFGLQLGSLFYLYFPAIVIGSAGWAWRRRRLASEPGEAARLILVGYSLFVCLYVLVIGALFENGENERFRFATEPLTLVLATGLIQAGWAGWSARRRARSTTAS